MPREYGHGKVGRGSEKILNPNVELQKMSESEIFWSFTFVVVEVIYLVGGLEESRVNYSELAWWSVPLSAWQMHTIDQSGCQASLLAPGHKPRMGLKLTRHHAFLWIKRLRGVPCPERLFIPLTKNEEEVLFNSDTGSAGFTKIHDTEKTDVRQENTWTG